MTLFVTRFVTVFVACGLAQGAVADSCLLRDATYTQAETGYGLDFTPLDPETSGLMTSNVFAMTLPGSAEKLTGEVIWKNGESRPLGSLRHGCPDPMTDDDEEICTHWQGVLYGITGTEVALLPREDGPAPEQILFPNLGQILRYSQVFFTLQLSDIPWDVFKLEGCVK